jgi:hypothetical protein
MLCNGFGIVLHADQNNKNSPRVQSMPQQISIIK